MALRHILFASAAAISLTACATKPKVAPNFINPGESVSVVLMKPDVEVKFDKIGSTDLRADWTEQAETNLKQAIIEHLKGSGETVTEFISTSISQDEYDQLIALNEQVNTAMGRHVMNVGNTVFMGTLPHKADRKNELNYSLGEAIDPIKASTNADYAVFMTYRAVIESGGSFLTKVAVGTLTGYVPAGSDFRGTMVNIVDLKTGEVVWLNAALAGGALAGDARDLKNARKTINGMMDKGPFVEANP